MKRITNYLIAMALMAFTFTSCEDVPNPFGQILPPSQEEETETFTPEGSGTQADPYNVQGVLEYVTGLGADVQSDKDIYIKGYVITIKEQYSAQYGNAQFTISDSKEGGNTFTFYRGLYLGNKKWAEGDATLNEGDEVIICGKVVNYKGTTPETVQNAAYLYSLNGKTEGGGGDTPAPTSDLGTKDAPLTVAKALEVINALPDNGTASPAYVKGKISKVQSYNEKYKSITYYISDDGTDNNALQVYSGKGLDGAEFAAQTDLETGWTVVVTGELKKYVNANTGAVTLEINQSSQIVSLDKTSGGGDTPTSELGTKDAPLTVAKALDAINALADGGETETEAYVKGKISKVQSFNDKYKSITYYISDDGTETKELQIYSGKNIDGAEFASKDDLSAGDEVVVKGKLKKFMKNNEAVPEMNQPNEIISITKAGGGDTPAPTGAYLDESFANGKGNFTIDDKVFSGVWTAASYGSDSYMMATSYVKADGESAKTNHDAESWLISPEINLSSATNPVLTFAQVINKFFGTIAEEAMVFAKKENGNWTKLTITYPATPSSSFSKFTDDGANVSVSLADYKSSKTQIAFVYKGSSTKAGTWEIKDVKVAEAAQ